MNKCIKCGSYAFNLYKEDIYQGGLCDVHYWQGRAHRAEALAQPEQEPVEWYSVEGETRRYGVGMVECAYAIGRDEVVHVVTHESVKDVAMKHLPTQRKPLTDEQRFDLLTKFEPHKNKWEAPAILIDMVEAVHGITGEKNE